MWKRTKLGLLREWKAQSIEHLNWLCEQRDDFNEMIRKENEVLDELCNDIALELENLKPVAKGTPMAIDFVTGNPDD